MRGDIVNDLIECGKAREELRTRNIHLQQKLFFGPATEDRLPNSYSPNNRPQRITTDRLLRSEKCIGSGTVRSPIATFFRKGSLYQRTNPGTLGTVRFRAFCVAIVHRFAQLPVAARSR
jgi:hypothetical protein